MTSGPITRIRPRLMHHPQPERLQVGLTLPDDAVAGLARVTGGRPAEELVVLAAAGAIVLAAAEHTDNPGLLVVTSGGPVAISVDLSEADTLASTIRAIDMSLKLSQATSPVPAEAFAVGSARLGGSPVGAGVELWLNEDDPRSVMAMAEAEFVDQWFLEVLLRSVADVLAHCQQPQRLLAEFPGAALADLAVVGQFAAQAFDPAPPAATLISPIREAARQRPSWPAVQCGAETLSYEQMWRQAETVAAHLGAQGVGAGDRIAVHGGKSLETIPVILGVLLARAAYVPLDADWPMPRIAAILDDADCAAVVVADTLRSSLPAMTVPVWSPARVLADHGAVVSADGPLADDLAYIVYTSGSTGAPKGVAVTHAAIASYFRWKIDYHRLSPTTRLLQTASFAFDGGTSDIFAILGAGGTLVLVDMHNIQARQLGELARRHRITDVNTVPSLYRIVVDELATAVDSLRLVMVGGETTTADLVRRHHDLLPRVRLVNEYGPTECSIAATAFDHAPDAGPGNPVGRPINNTVLTVCAADGRRRPVGFVGEMRIAGHGLALGYHRNPAQTSAAFVNDDTAPFGRAYQSGDLGWWRPDGMLEFVGRGDNQVKIRGQRVEFGEVESVLGTLDGVRANAVVATTQGTGLVLVAFVESSHTPEALQAAAGALLPPVMRPSRIEVLAGLPRMANGKIDRTALVAMAGAAPVAATTSGDAEPLVRMVAEVFGELLNIEPPARDADFFELGGHSLMALSAISTLEQRTGVTLDLDDFMNAASVATVAGLLRTTGEPVRPLSDPDALFRLLPGAGSTT